MIQATHFTEAIQKFANRVMALSTGTYLLLLDKKTNRLMSWQACDMDKVKPERLADPLKVIQELSAGTYVIVLNKKSALWMTWQIVDIEKLKRERV